jgi:hypothetical protein
MSSLSKKSIETLLDLVGAKLSCLEVYDREDAREKSYLENSRRELTALMRAASEPVRAARSHASPAAFRLQFRSAAL